MGFLLRKASLITFQIPALLKGKQDQPQSSVWWKQIPLALFHTCPESQQHLPWLKSGMSLIYKLPLSATVLLPLYLELWNYLQFPKCLYYFTLSCLCPHSFFWLEYHCGSSGQFPFISHDWVQTSPHEVSPYLCLSKAKLFIPSSESTSSLVPSHFIVIKFKKGRKPQKCVKSEFKPKVSFIFKLHQWDKRRNGYVWFPQDLFRKFSPLQRKSKHSYYKLQETDK